MWFPHGMCSRSDGTIKVLRENEFSNSTFVEIRKLEKLKDTREESRCAKAGVVTKDGKHNGVSLRVGLWNFLLQNALQDGRVVVVARRGALSLPLFVYMPRRPTVLTQKKLPHTLPEHLPPLLYERYGKVVESFAPCILYLFRVTHGIGEFRFRATHAVEKYTLAFIAAKHQVFGTGFHSASELGLMMFVFVHGGVMVDGIVTPAEAEGGSAGAGGIVAKDGFIGSDLDGLKYDGVIFLWFGDKGRT